MFRFQQLMKTYNVDPLQNEAAAGWLQLQAVAGCAIQAR